MKKKQSDHEKKAKKEKSTFFARTIAATAPRMTIECAERYALLLCGCKKIAAYSPVETLIATAACRVRVRGAGLCISFAGDGKILLSGTISAIEFE